MERYPKSRVRGLRTSRGDAGALVVYDVEHDAGHVLNAAAAVVYELADGSRSTADIAQRLSDRLGGPADEDVVRLALDDLRDARLLDTYASTGTAQVSRRDLMRRFAVGATAAAFLPGLGSIDNLSRAVAPGPRLVGSSGQAGAGYYLQPFHSTFYGPTQSPYQPVPSYRRRR